MLRNGWRTVGVLAVAAGAASAAAGAGFAPSEKVLPATTRAWASAADAAAFRDRFDRSALGRLFDEPAMQDFYDALDEKRSSVAGDRLGFGITPKELSGVNGGEIVAAAVEGAEGKLAGLLLVDTTGHEGDVPALLEKVYARLEEKGGKRVAGPEGIAAFELPPLEPREGEAAPPVPPAPRRLAYATAPGALVAGTDAAAVAATLPHLAAGRDDCLDTLEAFRAVMDKTGAGVPAGVPTGRWFVDPLAFAEARRRDRPAPKKPSKRKPVDYLEMARRNGFDCIRGAGGTIFFGEGRVDLRSNTLVYAPATSTSGEGRYEKAARILDFPNVPAITPPPWVPGDAANWMGLRWDLPAVFRALEPLVDDLVGEPGVFDDVISSLKEDPDGPQIDVENDLIRHLAGAMCVAGDSVTPYDVDCERTLIALETTDPETVAATIAKSMATEANTKRVEYGGHVIWETVPDEEGKTGRSTRVRTAEDDDDRPRGSLGGDAETSAFPNGAVAVANGHVLIASHRDILEKVLDGKAPPFEERADYREAVEQLSALLPGDVAMRTFARSASMVRPTYELLRAGKGPENKSLTGRLANALLDARDNPGSGFGKKSKGPRAPRIDGTKLPEFERIAGYFGTAGMSMQTVPEGWMFVGASLWDGGEPALSSGGDAAEPAGTAPATPADEASGTADARAAGTTVK